MAAPNLGNLLLHAAGKITGASGALTDGVNILSVVRNGTGDYTITLGSEIDSTQRHVALTLETLAGISALQPGGDTDTTFQVLTFDDSAVAADRDFQFVVTRVSLPG